MKWLKWLKYVIVFTSLLAISLIVFWFYGAPLSEVTSYKMAEKDVRVFASKHNIDLNLYNGPKLESQVNKELYIFEWIPKNGGKPITACVDPMRVEVTVDND